MTWTSIRTCTANGLHAALFLGLLAITGCCLYSAGAEHGEQKARTEAAQHGAGHFVADPEQGADLRQSARGVPCRMCGGD